MLPNYYELTRENTKTSELKGYRVLAVFNILLKLLAISLISITVIFSEYYWFLVVCIFLFSMLISYLAGNIAKNYKYSFNENILTITRVSFSDREKVLFKDNVKNCKFTKKFAQNTIVTTTEPFGAIITNNKDYILFMPDRYLIGLIENGMRK